MIKTNDTPLNRFDVMSMYVRRLTAEAAKELDESQKMDELADRISIGVDEAIEAGMPCSNMQEQVREVRWRAVQLRESAMRSNGSCYGLVHRRATDGVLEAMGFDPADFEPMPAVVA